MSPSCMKIHPISGDKEEKYSKKSPAKISTQHAKLKTNEGTVFDAQCKTNPFAVCCQRNIISACSFTHSDQGTYSIRLRDQWSLQNI